MDKSSSLAELRPALNLLNKECLNEAVLNGKKWAKAIKRFTDLREKLESAIDDRVQKDYKTIKMLLKCTERIL